MFKTTWPECFWPKLAGFAEMAKDQYSELATLVFDEWKKSELLVQHGSRCYLAQIGRKDGVNRAEVAANHDLLAPVLRHIGFLFEIVLWVIFRNHFGITLQMLANPWISTCHALYAQDFAQHYLLWWRLSKCSSIFVDPEENHCQPVGALQCWKSISVGNWSTLNILNLDTRFRHHHHIHHPNLYPNPQLPAAFKGKVVRVEAWILRRLVYVFTRVARRGHRPREFSIRSLMEVANIPVPERTTSSSRSLSWELTYRTDL